MGFDECDSTQKAIDTHTVNKATRGKEDGAIGGEVELLAGLLAGEVGLELGGVDATRDDVDFVLGYTVGLVEDVGEGLAECDEAIAAIVDLLFNPTFAGGVEPVVVFAVTFVGPRAVEGEGYGGIFG